MNHFRYIAISFATILTLSANASTPSLNIIQGAKSSTSRAQHNIVATTEPGNRAFINGKEVKVYSTGAFADVITLHHSASSHSKPKNNSRQKRVNYK